MQAHQRKPGTLQRTQHGVCLLHGKIVVENQNLVEEVPRTSKRLRG